eukprot:2719-Heterococcus_DN1.PRE.1
MKSAPLLRRSLRKDARTIDDVDSANFLILRPICYSALNITFERSSLMTAAAAKPTLYKKAYDRIRAAMGSLVVTGNEITIDVFAVKLGGDPKVAPEAHRLLSLYKSNVTASLDVQQRKSLRTDTPLNHAAAYALALERVSGAALTQNECRALAHALADGTTAREVLDAKVQMAQQCGAGGSRPVSKATAAAAAAAAATHSKAQRSSSDASGATAAAATTATTTGKGKQRSSSRGSNRARSSSSSAADLDSTAHDDDTALRTEQDLVSEVAHAAAGGSSSSNSSSSSAKTPASSEHKQAKPKAAVLLTPRERRAKLLALPVNPALHPDYIAFCKADPDFCSDDEISD